MEAKLENFKPAVSRGWLLIVAGLMWSAVGLVLCGVACRWLGTVRTGLAVPSGIAGILLATATSHFGFSRIARKNIHRIFLSPERACVFSFQAWRGYLIIIVMIALGYFLRHSPIPRYYLAIPYGTIGGALLLSSVLYYVAVWKIRMGGRSEAQQDTQAGQGSSPESST